MSSWEWIRLVREGDQLGLSCKGMSARQSIKREQIASFRSIGVSVDARWPARAKRFLSQVSCALKAVQRRTWEVSSGAPQQGQFAESCSFQVKRVLLTPQFLEPCLVLHHRLPGGRTFISRPEASQSIVSTLSGWMQGVGCK
jgi:hypothetical protein